jgi:hypothetical protein
VIVPVPDTSVVRPVTGVMVKVPVVTDPEISTAAPFPRPTTISRCVAVNSRGCAASGDGRRPCRAP